jgi:hypothetical protein
MSECQGPAGAESLPGKGPDALRRVLRGILGKVRLHSIGPGRDDAAFGDGPPILEPGGELGDHGGVGSGKVVVLVRIGQEIKKLRADLCARVMASVASQLAVVGEQEFPWTIDDPAIKQACLGAVDIGHVMREGFAEDRLARRWFAGFEYGQEIVSGKAGRGLWRRQRPARWA